VRFLCGGTGRRLAAWPAAPPYRSSRAARQQAPHAVPFALAQYGGASLAFFSSRVHSAPVSAFTVEGEGYLYDGIVLCSYNACVRFTVGGVWCGRSFCVSPLLYACFL